MNENKPFWDENRRRYAKILAWAIVVLAILGADMLGLRLPIPEPPIDDTYLVFDSVTEDVTTFTTLATTSDASVGGALAVTGASTFTGAVTNSSTVALASGEYPLEYTTSGSQLVFGTDSITGTDTAAHGLTTVTFAVCTLGEDPEAGGGDAAMCTVSIAANVVTLDIWQDNFVTAATEVSVVIHWLVVGVP
jgi:hypothetical protein